MLLAALKQRLTIEPDFRLFLAAGQLALVAGIVLMRFDFQIPVLDFIEGMLIGFSSVANLAGLIFYRRSQKSKGENNGQN